METVEGIIKELLAAMGYPKADVAQAEVGGQTVYSVGGAERAHELIGARGETIHAIDHLVKKIAEKRFPAGASEESENRGPLFLVDVGEYRARQIRDLQAKAKMMAERARSLRYDVELSPMSAYERLIVHTALAQEPHVKTESQGEGRGRRVVIKYSAE